MVPVTRKNRRQRKTILMSWSTQSPLRLSGVDRGTCIAPSPQDRDGTKPRAPCALEHGDEILHRSRGGNDDRTRLSSETLRVVERGDEVIEGGIEAVDLDTRSGGDLDDEIGQASCL